MIAFTDTHKKILGYLLVFAVSIYFVKGLFLRAWVGDDAYITFRVLDNFIHGHGLRWNIHERVQAYTNPLWLFVHIPFYFFWQNVFLLTIALSILFVIGTAFISARFFAFKPIPMIFILVALISSKSWKDYAVSGLENPLTFFLIALLLYHFVARFSGSKRDYLILSLLTALCAVNRLDLIILCLPMWAWLCMHMYRSRQWPIKAILIGALPLIIWLGFSLFYYGFLFPNTKYAKLFTGISLISYIQQGLRYVLDFLLSDTVGFLLLSSAAAITAYTAYYWKSRNNTEQHLSIIMMGALAYCVYTLMVGGDFMSGRFFSAPVYIAIMLLAHHLSKIPSGHTAAIMCLCLVISHWQVDFTREYWRSQQCEKDFSCFPYTISDERVFYEENWLMDISNTRIRTHPEHWFLQYLPNIQKDHAKPYVTQMIGMLGYYAGAEIKIIDILALSDPLLSRLPTINTLNWHVGHYYRAIPTGYEYAIETGRLSVMDENLQRYYKHLRLITSGNLWSWERIKTIFLFNIGVYDHFREAYVNEHLQ